jgi:hypothetical protein
MCLVDDRIVSSLLPGPPSRRAIPPSIALDAASHAKSSSPNGLKPMRDTESGEQHFSIQTRSVRNGEHRDIRLIYAQVLEIGNLQKPAVADPGSGKVSLGLARRGDVAA